MVVLQPTKQQIDHEICCAHLSDISSSFVPPVMFTKEAHSSADMCYRVS